MNTMKTLWVAVTSQNRKHVTPHAGKCRNFWLYEIAPTSLNTCIVKSKKLFEYSRSESFSQTGELPKELEHINVFVTGGIGLGFKNWLSKQFIACEMVSIDTLKPVEDVIDSLLTQEMSLYY